MINISGKPLPEDSIKVLSKGLSFAPTCSANEFKTKIDLFRFYRNLHLKAWYKRSPTSLASSSDTSQTDSLVSKTFFKPRSTFCPLFQNAALNTFEKKVNFDIENLFKNKNKRTPAHSNLSHKEKTALETLLNDDAIVIKKADKGGAIVVWSKDMYIKEAHQFNFNIEFYQPLTHNPTESLKEDLKEILREAKEKGWITNNESEFLYNENPRMASFCFLRYINLWRTLQEDLLYQAMRVLLSQYQNMWIILSNLFCPHYLHIYRILQMF